MSTEDDINPRLKELQELVELGEMVSTKIEMLRETVARMRDKLLYQLIAFYVVLVSAGFGFKQSLSSESELYKIGAQLVIVVVVLIAAVLFIRTFTSAVRQRRKLGREIDVESDILSRLVRMIYDQFKLVQSSEEMSAVTRALIEMRIQRLQSK